VGGRLTESTKGRPGFRADTEFRRPGFRADFRFPFKALTLRSPALRLARGLPQCVRAGPLRFPWPKGVDPGSGAKRLSPTRKADLLRSRVKASGPLPCRGTGATLEPGSND